MLKARLLALLCVPTWALTIAPPAAAQVAEIYLSAADVAAPRQRVAGGPGIKSVLTLAGGAGEVAETISPPNGAAARGQDVDSPPTYPGDLQYFGGPTLARAQFHDIYVLLPGQTTETVPVPSTWGDPEDFLRDLGNSDFIHVVDQYVGSTDDGRYTLGDSVIVHFDPGPERVPTQMLDSDAASIAHAVAAYLGVGGANQLFHVFLPPGTDICYDPPYVGCYSPDNPSTWTVCAYHYAASFSDMPLVVYSVEPYQGVAGCLLPGTTANGPLIDSTDTALEHETFEAITDSEGVGSAWDNENTYVSQFVDTEIADECQFVNVDLSTGSITEDVPTFLIGPHLYTVQSMYSNAAHACVTRP
jgi:hypothetical protein